MKHQKIKVFSLLKLEIKNHDILQLSSVAQTLDINSYRINNHDNYNLENLRKISVINNKEN